MNERGSATVELALLVPLLLVLLLLIVEVAGAARTQIELVAAAREGVRVAAVNPDPARALAVTRGALGGRGDDARIRVHRPHIVGRVAEVTVTLERHFALPLLGRFSVPLAARAAMRVER
jgi:hypothetical protein